MIDLSVEIKNYIKNNHISFREFAKICNLPNSTLQSICERGIFAANFSNVLKIMKVLKIDFSSLNEDNYNLSFVEREIIHKYRFLSFHQKKGIELHVDHEYSLYIDSLPKKIPVKIFLQSAAAGLGDFVDDDSFEELLFDFVPKGADFGVRISGDSMEPKINNGEIVFVKRQESLEVGEIGIYFVDGSAFCKKLIYIDGTPFLQSINNKYEDILLDITCSHLVGKVVGTTTEKF